MIHLLKTNYQQEKKKKDNIPRQQKGNQVCQSCFWTAITYPLGNVDFWNYTTPFIFTLMMQVEKDERTPSSYPLFYQIILKTDLHCYFKVTNVSTIYIYRWGIPFCLKHMR